MLGCGDVVLQLRGFPGLTVCRELYHLRELMPDAGGKTGPVTRCDVAQMVAEYLLDYKIVRTIYHWFHVASP